MVMFLSDVVDKTRRAVSSTGAISNGGRDSLRGDLKIRLCVHLVQEQNTRSKTDRPERRKGQIPHCHRSFESVHPSA